MRNLDELEMLLSHLMGTEHMRTHTRGFSTGNVYGHLPVMEWFSILFSTVNAIMVIDHSNIGNKYVLKAR